MTNSRPRLAVLCSLLLVACGGGGETPPDTTTVIPKTDSISTLTPFQLEHGIGPVTEVVVLGTLDAALAAKGKTAFETWCLTCHRLQEDFLGPSLGEVTTRRSPTYIMNMILDPTGMTERHPVAKALLAKFTTPMVKLVTSTDDARAIVEYLRTEAKGTVRTQ